jgi:hypothetical protein
VSVQGNPLYVFKKGTISREIRFSKKLSSLTNVPEGIFFVGISHFASQEDFDGDKFFEIATVSDHQINELDPDV